MSRPAPGVLSLCRRLGRYATRRWPALGAVLGAQLLGRFLPMLIDLVWKRKINPGKVFDLTLPLDQVAEGYRAMDERRAIKALLLP